MIVFLFWLIFPCAGQGAAGGGGALRAAGGGAAEQGDAAEGAAAGRGELIRKVRVSLEGSD